MASDAVYRPIPQAPVESRASADLEVEHENIYLEDVTVRPFLVADSGKIRGIHFILGCAVLLPWNALITATPYFVSCLNGSHLQSTFSSYLSTAFTTSGFVSLAYATFTTTNQSSNSRRVVVTIFWLALLTAMLALSTAVRLPAGLFFAFVLLNGVLQAAIGSYLQLAVVAVASLFGPEAMQALMSGQAAVGVLVSGVQLLSAAASTRSQASPEIDIRPPPPHMSPEARSARLFFLLSTLFLGLSAAVNVRMTKMPVYKAVMAQSTRAAERDDVRLPEESDALTNDAPEYYADEKRSIYRLAKSNLPYNFAVAYAFVVTLSVFPPITVSVQPTNAAIHPLLFSAIHFVVFNIGDFTGRTICSLPRLATWSASRLLILSLARTLFIPLFLMCNVQRSPPFPGGPSPPSPLIGSDALFMLILLLFGSTGGYVSSMCMMSAPSLEHNPRLQGRAADVGTAAMVANFCLIGGLTLGSLASFAVRAAVCDCNPFKE